MELDNDESWHPISRRRKAMLWLGLGLFLPGAAYAALAFVYFVWAAGLQHGATGRAGVFAAGALALAVLCAGLFIHCLLELVRDRYRAAAARRGRAQG